MYILQNKFQLNSFVNSIREQLLVSFDFSPKPAKLREVVAQCIGENSYAAVISKLPMRMEVLNFMFPMEFASILANQPYGLKIDWLQTKAICENAILNNAYWDEQLALEVERQEIMAIQMAAAGEI